MSSNNLKRSFRELVPRPVATGGAGLGFESLDADTQFKYYFSFVVDACDFAYSGDPSVIKVHISNIRRKLDRPFGTHSILTIRGSGYRLVNDRG